MAGPIFLTPSHAYPYPNFQFSSSTFNVGDVVEFIQDKSPDSALCFVGGQSSLCEIGASVNYGWDFNYKNPPGFIVTSTYKGNATTTYSATGTYDTMLRITDDVGTCYSEIKSINVGATGISGLPKWKEVSP